MMKKTEVTIVIPVYNEQRSLEELQRVIEDVLKKNNLLFECIYVDDGSSDGSFEILKKIKEKSASRIVLLRLRKHLGKSAALAVGFTHAKGNKIVTIDADLQDDPYEIPKLLKKLDEGYSLVGGWRINRRDSWQKVLLSRIFNRVVSLTTGIKLHDFNTGLKACKQDVIREINLYGELHRFISVLAVSRGFQVTEIPVHHYKRKYGKSKFGLKRIIHAAFDLIVALFLISFNRQPMQLFGLTGGLFTFIGFIILIYLSYLRFLGETIGTRPLFILGVLLVLFGVQLISTGLLAELLTNYTQSKNSYPIDQVLE